MANQREKNGRLQGGEEEQKARKPNESAVRVLPFWGRLWSLGRRLWKQRSIGYRARSNGEAWGSPRARTSRTCGA